MRRPTVTHFFFAAAALIGVFLAVLELVRHHQVHAEQESAHGEIYLLAGESFKSSLDLSDVDDYDGSTPSESDQETDMQPKPR